MQQSGLSKEMIGNYLGQLQKPINMTVLDCLSKEVDLKQLAVDTALRKFQSYFRMPGEAQKIAKLMNVFAERYIECNGSRLFRSPDTVFVLSYATMMLNTDLHTPHLKSSRRMNVDDFMMNLRGVDNGVNIRPDILRMIYLRVKEKEFQPAPDHVMQVLKIQSTIVGEKLNLALPHRRLVSSCSLYEIADICKTERPELHKRRVFLFNDLLIITKEQKKGQKYSFLQSFHLLGMVVTQFEDACYQYGIRLSQRADDKVLVTFNAFSEYDYCKFCDDLCESICEMEELDTVENSSDVATTSEVSNVEMPLSMSSESEEYQSLISVLSDLEEYLSTHSGTEEYDIEEFLESN